MTVAELIEELKKLPNQQAAIELLIPTDFNYTSDLSSVEYDDERKIVVLM